MELELGLELAVYEIGASENKDKNKDDVTHSNKFEDMAMRRVQTSSFADTATR